MAGPEQNNEPPHWFWRGVQSAIFYYVSCAPCLDYRYKSQRRREAKIGTKQEMVTVQPGLVRQPRAFETNTEWTEEVLLGPGPPKGWQPHQFVRDARKKRKRSVYVEPTDNQVTSQNKENQTPAHAEEETHERPPRPSLHERRISNAFENVKGTLRSSLHPERWNWKRYDREDEFLGGISNTVTKMWDRVASTVGYSEDPNSHALDRAKTQESERIDYSRGHIPAVNDLHPPVVSRLPVTREEVAWMILPPPSAAVMAGKKPPGEEVGPRKPICIIGRPQIKTNPLSKPEPLNPIVDDSTIETSSIEIWDAQSVATSLSAPSTPPARVEISKRKPPAPHMFDALSDTEMFKIPPRPAIRERPHSWQVTYVIPSPPASVHIR